MGGEIFVLSGYGHGHLHPCMELCNHLSSRDFQSTLVISSSLSSAMPSSFSQKVLPIAPSNRFVPGSDPVQAAQDLETHLTNHYGNQNQPPPLCAIVDFQMGWTKTIFSKFNIPIIGLFTFSACAAAMEWGAWKVQAADIKPGETRLIPGLPEVMGLTHSDLKRKRPAGPPPGGAPPTGRGRGGPPKPGDCPIWVKEIEGSIALMFSTCDDLERPFLSYMADQMGVPAFGVGPLLPENYWNPTSGSLISDRQIRGDNRQSNVTEDDVIQWLDRKPRGSVLYIAFGSEVGPTTEEYSELAGALAETTRPFIWAIQSGSGYTADGLESKVGDRGLIIYGWAPQLLILSHQSTGGFLSHCGWNSTSEAIGRGVRILAWPIRGDQYHNAKMVVNQLKIGGRVAEDMSEMVKKEDIKKGIEKVMGDEEMGNRAAQWREKFSHGFPASAEAGLDAFKEFITRKPAAVSTVSVS
ncbi:hypothetical protein SLE2022_091860 [Rubroshorea leprosula]